MEGRPYTLDFDQARAVVDSHCNTLVTARAGSGKTRVIVAKIAYLVAQKGYRLSEIAAFMFNRAAAAEVNQRIGSVLVEGENLASISARTHKSVSVKKQQANFLQSENEQNDSVTVASTFHKFALEIVKISGIRPQIISEQEQATIIRRELELYLSKRQLQLSTNRKNQYLQLISGFITRAGQRFPGAEGVEKLRQEVDRYCKAVDSEWRQLHCITLKVYEAYLGYLTPPKLDFNLLMSTATKLLKQCINVRPFHNPQLDSIRARIGKYKYLLVDEYQDFSYLFFDIIKATRQVCPASKLFAVGDDWQAINRFAGSDCDYFLNFDRYFSQDPINIPLATNYRSDRKIVEHANTYMLSTYDPGAIPARAFNKNSGRIYHLDPQRTRFDATDILEDGLSDGQYQEGLLKALSETGFSAKYQAKELTESAQLLKTLVKVIHKNRGCQIMLLHRHNFTSFMGIDLCILQRALELSLIAQNIMSKEDFDERVRIMTMHKSKGLEADVVILMEFNREIVASMHSHATIFSIFGDNEENERLDQCRLTYVALTRAKHKLYILSSDNDPVA